jgi:hypothetical protein
MFSRSTDKLNIINGIVRSISEEKMNDLISLKIDWKSLEEELLPTLEMSFKE